MHTKDQNNGHCSCHNRISSNYYPDEHRSRSAFSNCAKQTPEGPVNGAKALTENAIGFLQALMDKDQLMLQTISNIDKKLYDTAQSIVTHPDAPNMGLWI
jgi:hypothetical protein